MLYHNDNKIVFGSLSSFERYLFKKNRLQELNQEMYWIYTVLIRVRILGKTFIRDNSKRSQVLLTVSNKGSFYDHKLGLIEAISRMIFFMMRDGEINELENVCQRVGIANKIEVKKFFPQNEGLETEEYVASVLLDGVNIGFISDGTIRILCILMNLITPYGAIMVIEEPETQIHPGMLAKLLNEIEAYTFEKNLIISTHSPQVVAWTSPDKINLVHRENGRTFVQKLGEDEIQNVIAYLSEEGSLGEWIYSGVIDE